MAVVKARSALDIVTTVPFGPKLFPVIVTTPPYTGAPAICQMTSSLRHQYYTQSLTGKFMVGGAYEKLSVVVNAKSEYVAVMVRGIFRPTPCTAVHVAL